MVLTLLVLATVAPAPAAAYIGPGLGLSFVGSLFGVFWAILLAVAMVLVWPAKLLWRRLRGPAVAPADGPSGGASGEAPGPSAVEASAGAPSL